MRTRSIPSSPMGFSPLSGAAVGLAPVIFSIVLFVFTHDSLALIPVFLAALFGVLAYPKVFVLLLPFLGSLSGWHVQAAGINIRLDQGLSIVLSFALLVNVGLGKLHLRSSNINKFILVFLAVNVLSSMLGVDPKSSLFQLVNLASAISLYFVVLHFIETKREYQRFFRVVLIAGFCAMLYGLFLFFVGILGVVLPGVNLDASELAYGIYGSMREPNIFGSYSASMLMIGLTLLTVVKQPVMIGKMFLRIFSVVAAFALLLSYARAAWVGVVVALLTLVIHRRVWKQPFPLRVWGFVGIISIFVLLLFSFGVIPVDFYVYKIQNLFNFEEGTGEWRALIWLKAWSNFLMNPWLGNGTYSYAYFYSQESNVLDPGGENWISNLTLLVLHDTGIIGLVVFIVLIAAILRETKSAIRQIPPSAISYHAAAFHVAFVALLVAYQATSAFSLGFTWIVIALIALVSRYEHGDLKG